VKRNQKHTPGPWDLVPLAHCQVVQAGPNRRICELMDHQEINDQPCGSIASQDKTQEEIDANACLIAAAPELLAALRACCAALVEAGKDFAVNNPLAARPNLYELHAAAALAVIQKAEGN